MQIVPLFGFANKGKSVNVTTQRRLNLYIEQTPDAEKSQMALYTRPGLIAQTVATAGTGTGPVRGWGTQLTRKSSLAPTDRSQWVEFVPFVRGNLIYLGNPSAGYGTAVGPLPVLTTSAGPVSFADNGFEFIVVDGVAGYTCAHTGGTATLIADANFPNGTASICYIASRIVAVDPFNPGRFYWSALNDATSWDPLDFATAESNPDALAAVAESNGQLVLFGVATTEFWAPSGDASVFARIGGSGIQWGLGAPQSVAKYNDGLVFVGRNALGELQVAMLRAYQAQVVSTPDIDFVLNNDPLPTGATAFTFTMGGHSFYVLNLSQKTLVFDLTSGTWAEWGTEGGRFAGNLGVAAFGQFLVSDYRDGRVYRCDDETYTDGAAAIVREIQSRHVINNYERMPVFQLFVDCETGTGLNSGQGSDPQVMLQTSKDGGHTWGNEVWRSMGAMGQYLRRVVWNRLGLGDDWTFLLRITDPVKVVIINAAMRLRG